MFAITGATGNTGTIIAEKLLARRQKVRVIGRDAGRLARLVAQGAESFVAEMTDASPLSRAFEGASAVYAMIPPNMTSPDPRGYQESVSDALSEALSRAKVSHVVVLSSVGADKPEGTGPVAGLHSFEQKLAAVSGLNAVFLRAAYFLENFLPQAEAIKRYGVVAGGLRPDLLIPMIATRDIGTVAAEILERRDFTGKQPRELLGQRDVTCMEVTSIIGKAIGRPDLGCVQMPSEQLKSAMMQIGISAQVADALLELAEALNTGRIVALEQRSSQNTTPTSVESFVAEVFVPYFQAGTAAP
jgi:uncharacterized protein YbjT (DUF2867 family)